MIRSIIKLYSKTSESVMIMSIFISITLSLILSLSLHPLLIDNIPSYSDLIAGATVWSGYYKRGDLVFFNIFTASYLILLFILPVILTKVLGINNSKTNKTTQLLTNNHQKQKNAFVPYFLCSLLIFSLVTFIVHGVFPIAIKILFSYLIFIYLMLKENNKEDVTQPFIQFGLIGFFIYFNIVAGGVILNIINYDFFSLTFEEWRFFLFSLGLLAVLALLILYKRKKIGESAINKVLLLLQIPLPSLFLAMYQFRYDYLDGVVVQFYSGTLRTTLLGITMLFMLYNLIQYTKNSTTGKNSKIFITTMISLSGFLAYQIPSGSLLTDYFHNGENITPLHQLINFGSLPYLDMFPMHGLFNYARSAFNFIFFNGEYATLSAAYSIYNIFMAIVLCLLIIKFTRGKGELLTFILVIVASLSVNLLAGRLFGVFVMMIVLHNKNSERNSSLLELLWWWILTSIISVSWNPPLGGAASISFIPLIIHSFWKNRKNYSRSLEEIKASIGSWLFLSAIGYGNRLK